MSESQLCIVPSSSWCALAVRRVASGVAGCGGSDSPSDDLAEAGRGGNAPGATGDALVGREAGREAACEAACDAEPAVVAALDGRVAALPGRLALVGREPWYATLGPSEEGEGAVVEQVAAIWLFASGPSQRGEDDGATAPVAGVRGPRSARLRTAGI